MILRWSLCAPALAALMLLDAGPSRLAAQSQPRASVVRHAPALIEESKIHRIGEWSVAETSSFWVCCWGDELTPGEIGRHCEALRRQLIAKWLGDNEPAAWSPKCSVVLHPNRQSYLAAVGQEGAATVGSSLVERQAGMIHVRRVDLRGDRPDNRTAALPHELTHVILADRFAGASLPRWADEGIAILEDTEVKRSLHVRDLESRLAQGHVFHVADLLRMRDYPAAQEWGLYYAQSASLVEYLVGRATPCQFVAFLERTAAGGVERALRDTYGIASVEELNRDWLASLGRLAARSSGSR